MSPTVPSVTQVLEDVGLGPAYSSSIPGQVMVKAARRGSALHEAIRYHHEGDLEEESLHPELAPGFHAYLRFLAETDHRPIASELELVHPTWHFIGHPDRVGWHRDERVLIDWKYTADFDREYVRLQLAGYRILWNDTHPLEPVSRVFGLHLRKDGTYSLHDLTDSNAPQEFLAALMVWRARERRRR